jgi:hypothetical protein
MMVDLLTEGDVDFGIAPFDNLQRNQKLVALYSSARGLLRPDEPAPRLTAFIESAVATVFEFAQHQVYDEIDDPEFHGEASHWRKIVLEAARERVEAADMPAEQNAHKTAWSFLIESLAGCVLWDNDYEWQEPLDISPDAGNAVKSVLGMDDAYYTAVPEDPPDNQANLYLDALMGLTAEVR